jgi:glycine oxidase
MDESADLLVVGAGVIGLTAAWRAAQRGLSVRVVERDRVGRGATAAAAGILAPTDAAEWHGARGAVNLAAMAGWADFAAELRDASGDDVGYRRSGSLRLALDAAERRTLEELAASLAAAGVEHAVLDADACVAEEPGVRGAVAGLLSPGDAHVATDRLLTALTRACARAGVDLAERIEPTALLRARDGAVEGARLSDGTVQRAALTVVAAGAWTSQAPWLPPEARPPVRPLAGEYLLLRGKPVCRRIVRTAAGSIAPRADGRLWTGTTLRAAGYASLPGAEPLRAILDRWIAVIPAIADLGVERTGIGLRPATPDGMPFVGPTGIPGLALATGHGREGIIQAPLTGEGVAALAAGEPPPAVLAPFSPGRPSAEVPS